MSITPIVKTPETTTPTTSASREGSHRTLALGFLILSLLAGSVLARDKEPPKSFARDYEARESVDRKALSALDSDKLAAETRQREDRSESPGPYVFATARSVSFNLQNSGTWETLPEGGRLWRLSIASPGAKSLSLGLTSYELPTGAKLWIYDGGRTTVQGPYTAKHRSDKGRLFTPVVPGEEITLELFVPAGAAFEPVLEVGRVHHAFRDFIKSGGDKSGGCNNDVVCPEGNPWRDQIRSVARYSAMGTGNCTGQLVNNTDGDFTPYFLSANHCGIDASNDDTMVFYWNFESPNCGDQGGGSLSDSQVGAVFRASWAPSDFVLVELSDVPDADFDTFYTGWDATGATPSSAVAIHHPSADEKAISFENQGLTTTAYKSDSSDASEDHWRVADWDDGTTEPGSSGSCLWNPANSLCVGQLHGGFAACGNDDPDWYGKLSVSWEGGGSASTRLRDWLNPADDGTLLLPGADPPTPGPVMRLAETLLDYGEVELGFAFTKAVVVYNDGDAPLDVVVSNNSPGDPDLPQWSETNFTLGATIAPGADPLVLTQVYEPSALAVHDFEIEVTSNDPGNPAQTVLLQGEGVTPTPVDSVLVMDRSGSMDEVAW